MSKWTYRIGACGGTFTTPYGFLTSPSYPDKYPKNADCVYNIRQPNGTFINITFIAFDIDKGWHGDCIIDYLDIRDGNSEKSPSIGKFCGQNITTSFQSTQNSMWLRYWPIFQNITNHLSCMPSCRAHYITDSNPIIGKVDLDSNWITIFIPALKVGRTYAKKVHRILRKCKLASCN